ARPQPIVGGRMDEIARAAQRIRERATVADVANEDFVARLDVAARARGAYQHAHPIARAPRQDRDRSADKAAGTGDQNDVAGIRLWHAMFLVSLSLPDATDAAAAQQARIV